MYMLSKWQFNTTAARLFTFNRVQTIAVQGSAILLFSKKRLDKKVKREKKEESGDMDIYIIIIHTQGR